MASIGEQIISARKARNMTQETLAKLMFVSRPTISRWETDSVTPNAQALQRLSEVLGVRFVIGDAEAMQDQAQPSEDLGSASQVSKGESLAFDDRRGALQVLEGESLASEAEPGVSGEVESLPEGGAEAAEAPASERRRPLRRRWALLACAVGHRDGSSVPVFARSSEGFRRKFWSVSGTREPSPCPLLPSPVTLCVLFPSCARAAFMLYSICREAGAHNARG